MDKMNYIAMNSNPNEPTRMNGDGLAGFESDEEKLGLCAKCSDEIKLSLSQIEYPYGQTDLGNRITNLSELPGFKTSLDMVRSIEVDFKSIDTNVRPNDFK